ncbi:deoxyhypusine hydroxylase-like [Schistocerca gregaria]|uniref:deoxyhypusine hydroxylase-like n=1 Tax=Schistocerca gregaria TaxID=7010 RepID=UPI00211DE96D|nr:deoxyhypusine hydroxylase-like [Schistocerca gregaria]
MQDLRALNHLMDTVMDESLNVMVRHEAAEALGALGDVRALSVLENFKDSVIKELSETCEIAIQLIKWKLKHGAIKSDGPFTTFDPAPPSKSKDFDKLKAGLLNSNFSIFKRYKMLFALRNMNTRQSALAICAAFGTGSPLFEHELAYVLGQMAFEVTASTLAAVLEDTTKHEMVRHEAAEALGSIADKSSLVILQKHAQDDVAVVKESCMVALDLHDYYNSDELQYADGLSYADAGEE